MNPFALLSLLVVAGFPVAYTLQARGGIGGGRARRAHKQSPGTGGMSPAEAAALEAARQEGAAGAGQQGGDELGALLAALLQGRGEGIGITPGGYGQQLTGLEAGMQNFYDGVGYPQVPEAPATTTGELVTSGPGGTNYPYATTYPSPSGATVTETSPGGIVVTAPASSGGTPGPGQGYSIGSIDPYSGAPHFNIGIPTAGSPKVA